MISDYLNALKRETSRMILVGTLILSLFSGFTTSKSQATTSKTQTEWVIGEKGKKNFTSGFQLNSASRSSFSDHSLIANQLFQARRVEIKLKKNQHRFLSFPLSHSKILPQSSDEDPLLA